MPLTIGLMSSKLYLDDLRGWIFDEQTSVSYLWLARELGCSSEDAKR